MLSAAEKMPVKPPLNPQLGNTSLNQINGLNFTNYNYFHNGPNFIPLGKISQQEKIEIIQTGFQLQVEGKISLKKYYYSTQKFSLF